jgi:uncharacterized protein (DUF983 family)
MAGRPLGVTMRAMARGFLLRCPRCEEGRMSRAWFWVGGDCPSCGLGFELGAGDFSGAIMIAQMLMGLMAIPVWLLLGALTPLGFTGKVVSTVLILMILLLVFYRNVKGMWYGFLIKADEVQRQGILRP